MTPLDLAECVFQLSITEKLLDIILLTPQGRVWHTALPLVVVMLCMLKALVGLVR